MPEAHPAAIQIARTLVAVFFREIEVVGAGRVPAEGPLLVVANHHNSLVDPALLLARLPRPPRFLAKSTLWKTPGLRQLLDLAASIPVYRRQDEGEDTSRNRETFAACHEALAAGGVIALFPEGVSHDAPHLAPLRTGAARIALEAEEAHGPLRLRIVPVGLTFDDKKTFRSRALLTVGEPIGLEDALKLHAEDARGAARELTEKIDEALRRVTLNVPSPEDVPLLERASEVMAAAGRELPARLALAEAFALRRGVIDAYERLAQRHPAEVAGARERAAHYHEALARYGLRDDQVAAHASARSATLFVLGYVSLLLFWLPFAALGTLLNWVPYRLCGVAARFTKTEDLPATFKLMSGFVLFPIAWAIEAGLAGWLWGAGGALALLFLGPATAWVAMRFHERYDRFLEEAAAWLRLRVQRARTRDLRALRARLARDLDRLRDLDRRER